MAVNDADLLPPQHVDPTPIGGRLARQGQLVPWRGFSDNQDAIRRWPRHELPGQPS